MLHPDVRHEAIAARALVCIAGVRKEFVLCM